MQPGRVVILLAGRRAGKKAVIVKANDNDKKKGKNFGYALVAGVERYPLKVTKRMVKNKNKMKRRTSLKPFVKQVNYNHLLPTRFRVTGEFAKEGAELKSVVTEEKLNSAEAKKALKKEVKAIFVDRYNSPDPSNEKQPAVDFFFKKLRF